MKKLLIVDTETNGLPVTFNAPMSDVTNWPRITQFAWELCWENGETITQMCELVKPDGWVIPKQKFWIENGFSTEENEKYGLDMQMLMKYFIADLEQADLLIAHNMSFDLPVITCEMFRYKLKPANKTEKYCTKLATTDILKLPGFFGKYKWPSLEEAYTYFFGKMPTGAHQADFDVEACKKIYLAIQALNKQ